MGNPFFHFRQFSILQQEEGLKLTTDACLLGALARHHAPARILDIGTGTGVIALFLAQRYPDSYTEAIELQENVYRQACQNIGNSIFAGRIRVLCGDFLKMDFAPHYDLIVSNPPYFTGHLAGKNASRNTAMHNQSLATEDLLKKASLCLSDEGQFWLIYPPAEAEKARTLALDAGLHLYAEIQICNKPGKHFRTLLALGRKPALSIQHSKMDLQDENGARSAEFHRLMLPFYLENTEIYKKPR